MSSRIKYARIPKYNLKKACMSYWEESKNQSLSASIFKQCVSKTLQCDNTTIYIQNVFVEFCFSFDHSQSSESISTDRSYFYIEHIVHFLMSCIWTSVICIKLCSWICRTFFAHNQIISLTVVLIMTLFSFLGYFLGLKRWYLFFALFSNPCVKKI